MAKRKKTLVEQRQAIINEYIHGHNDEPAQMEVIAQWALNTGRIEVPQPDIVKMVAKQLADAAREDYYEDPQGREVRRKHQFRKPVKIGGKEVQRTFWVDVDRATPGQMQLSFAFRRRAALMDVTQLQKDVDSWNENQRLKWANAPRIQLDFNYNLDLAEQKQPTTYPDSRPEDEDDDEV